MDIYFLILGPLFLLAYSAPCNRNVALMMGGYMFLVAGLRYDVGFDYPSYYEWCKNGLDPYLKLSMEPFSLWMINLVSETGVPQLFFVWTSLLIVGLFVAAFLRQSSAPALSLFTFFCMPMMYLVSLGIIRQYLAISMVFFALSCFGRRFFVCMALMILAAMFHYSAFLICILYLGRRFLECNYKTAFYVFVLLTAPILSSFVVKIIGPLLPFYTSYLDGGGSNGTKMIILYYTIALLLVAFRRHLLVHVEVRYFNLFLFGVFVYGLAGPVNEVVGRIAYYFLPFFCLLLPAVIRVLRPPELSRMLVMLLLSLLFFAQLYVASQDPNKDQYQPYSINTDML